jgi:hypothetical protein
MVLRGSAPVESWIEAIQLCAGNLPPEAGAVLDDIDERTARENATLAQRVQWEGISLSLGRSERLAELERILADASKTAEVGDELPFAFHALLQQIARRANTEAASKALLLKCLRAPALIAIPAFEAARQELNDPLYHGEFLACVDKALVSESVELKRSVIRLLGETRSESSTERLVKLLGDHQELVRIDSGLELLFRDNADAAAIVANAIYTGRAPLHLVPRLASSYASRAPKSGDDFFQWMRRMGLIIIESSESDDGP